MDSYISQEELAQRETLNNLIQDLNFVFWIHFFTMIIIMQCTHLIDTIKCACGVILIANNYCYK